MYNEVNKENLWLKIVLLAHKICKGVICKENRKIVFDT
jgi:hypothetical protein